MLTTPGPVTVPEAKSMTALGPTARPLPTVTVCPFTTSVWVPVEPPIIKSANAAATSSVTVYVPLCVINRVSGGGGGAPVLHLVPSLQLPPVPASQVTRPGG